MPSGHCGIIAFCAVPDLERAREARVTLAQYFANTVLTLKRRFAFLPSRTEALGQPRGPVCHFRASWVLTYQATRLGDVSGAP